jgi:hypothetical protein
MKLAFEAEHYVSSYAITTKPKVCYIKTMKMLTFGGDAMDDGYGYAKRNLASPLCCL